MLFYEKERSKGEHYLYHQFDTDLNFPLHLHRSFELIYVEEGELRITLGDRSFTVRGGETAIIAPNRLHSYSTPVRSVSYLCIFSPDYCYDLYTFMLENETDDPVFRLEDPAVIAALNVPDSNLFRIKSALYAVAGQFLSCCTFRPRTAGGDGALPETVIGWLQQHFREPITLKDLAAYTGYHYNYLSAWLHRQMNIGFSALVNEYRVDLASDLLIQTDLPVIEIAGRCGFETVRTFNRCFLRLRGRPPTAYRKNRRPAGQEPTG